MSERTPDNEHQRLAELYAGMSDGELHKLAADGPELTPEALQALKNELIKRGENTGIISNSVEYSEVEYRPLITIRRFRDFPPALTAQAYLHSAGIDCILADENVVRLDWFNSNALGGIRLQVPIAEAEQALELLNQPWTEKFEVEGIGEYENPHCPRCESLEVTFHSQWECRACGNLWNEEPQAST